jgi:hypothetical protein
MQIPGKIILSALFFLMAGCSIMKPQSSSSGANTSSTQPALGAGFRYSTYGPAYNPGPEYWVSVGKRMAGKFSEAAPEAIWIVSNFNDPGTFLSFPAETTDPNLTFSYVDLNEQTLSLFDQQGIKVWLQVEPGNVDVVELINLVLKQYRHHSCVIGFGVDVEWYQSDGSAEGKPVSDETAALWVKTVREINPNYRLFLKHWDWNWMPPATRDGIVFVDDSQQFSNFDQMISEFGDWGRHFSPAPVAFQFGYPADKPWWGNLEDPPGEIGRVILQTVPNTTGLYWVDFSVLEVFPPQP